eukprot:Phypoly_transcript_03800.p1 GENE.Phypoly_transcript_03800~~Phypoly_transcript_03800.p1  ORF type:complete len:653 (+),score=171.43 Phypoly_transcript_03800:39-1961(+)
MNPYQQPPPYMYGGFPVPPVRFPPPNPFIQMPPMPPMPAMPPMGMPMPPMVPLPIPPHAKPTPVPTPTPIVPKPIVVEQTTVYVGKIPPTVEDEFIRKLLEFCGDVAFWRRVTDPTSGQLKGFAFCDFKSPEGVLRALRLLNGLEIDEHQLLLKVDDKNQKLLDAYIAKRNAEQHGIVLKPGDTIAQTAEALAKEKDEDDTTKTKIDELVGRVHRVLAARRAGKDPAEEDIADGDPTKQDKASVVSREIKNFRERQAQRDLEKKDRQREVERDKHNDDHSHHEFDRQKEIDRLRMLREREREKENRRRRDDRERERDWEQTERIRERKRDENKKRERRERDLRRREIEDQEYDSDEKARKRLRTREARKRREKEREEDELDRIKEREEIEQKKRAEEEKTKAEEQARIAQEAVDAEKRRVDQQQQQRAILQQQQQMLQQQRDHKHPMTSPDGAASPSEEGTTLKLGFSNKRTKITPVAGFVVDNEEDEVVVKKKPLVMLDQPEHKDNQSGASTNAPATGNGAKKQLANSAGRKVDEVQSVIDRIPTAKDDLFKIDIDWALIEKHKIIDRKMKPWVTKKIMEYLGEEEKTLIDFIMSKISAHISPAEILQQLTLVLDEEADIFVVKMWRMLVYEMYTASSK